MSAELAQPSAFVADATRARTYVAARATSVPWYIWAGALAVTSASIGGQWDVAWHRSIGRDTFWTPAHMAIYACGVIAGIVGMYLVLTATFGRSSYAARLRAASVNVFGLRAPLGVFLAGLDSHGWPEKVSKTIQSSNWRRGNVAHDNSANPNRDL